MSKRLVLIVFGYVLLFALQPTPASALPPSYSLRDEFYQTRPQQDDVRAEAKKSILILGLLLGGPLVVFAISGLKDCKREKGN